MAVTNRLPTRRSYLLQLWEEGGQDPEVPGVWRFSLEDPRTGTRRIFPSLEALTVALKQEMGGRGVDGRMLWASS